MNIPKKLTQQIWMDDIYGFWVGLMPLVHWATKLQPYLPGNGIAKGFARKHFRGQKEKQEERFTFLGAYR